MSLKIKEKEESSSEDNDDDEGESEGEVLAYFTRKLKRGSKKGKGQLSLRCYRCGKTGHFASRCKVKLDDEDEDGDDE